MNLPNLPRPTRRQALALAPGLGGLALASLLGRGPASLQARELGTDFPAKAKRAIWLFMAGGPSQLDLFDYKPGLSERFNEDLPASVKQGRLSTMTSDQARFPIAPSVFEFAQYGEAGTWVSELLPHTARAVDDIALIRTVSADAVNHDPAIMAMLTGAPLPGKPSVGSWLSYGLGALNQNLPTFVVLTLQLLAASFGAAAFDPAVGQRVLTGDPLGGHCALCGRAGAVSRQPSRARPHCASSIFGRDQGAEPTHPRAHGGPEYSNSHRPVRARVSHAERGARAHRPDG